MMFRCTRHPRLRVHGVGRFVDGSLDVDDPKAVARVEAVAETYGIVAVRDRTDPFDPTADGNTVDVVRAYLAVATPAEARRVLDLERNRTDRDPRSGVLELAPPGT